MHRDQLRIAEPCHADWTSMSGDERRRFCGSCTKHVHDLSAMTARQAERLVTSGQDLCVRYEYDSRGRLRHAPGRAARVLALGATLIGGPAMASSAPAPSAEPGLIERLVRYVSEQIYGPPEVGPTEILMGDIAPPPPPPPPKPEREFIMGKIAPPPKLVVPVEIPRPAPGETVIPEVEEALRTR